MIRKKLYRRWQLEDALRSFARNGRWGTCGSCPRDSDGSVYPEFCQETDRYDHNLAIDELAGAWKRMKSDDEESKP